MPENKYNSFPESKSSSFISSHDISRICFMAFSSFINMPFAFRVINQKINIENDYGVEARNEPTSVLPDFQ